MNVEALEEVSVPHVRQESKPRVSLEEAGSPTLAWFTPSLPSPPPHLPLSLFVCVTVPSLCPSVSHSPSLLFGKMSGGPPRQAALNQDE